MRKWFTETVGASPFLFIVSLHIFPILPLTFLFAGLNPISLLQAYFYAAGPFVVFGVPFLLYIHDKDRAPIEKSKNNIYNHLSTFDSKEEKIQYVESLEKKRVRGSSEVLESLRQL